MELGCINSGRDDTRVLDSGLDGRDSGRDRDDSGDLHLDLARIVLAGSLSALVGVVRVEHKTLLGVLKSIIKITPGAALAVLLAINELLLRENKRSLALLLGMSGRDSGDSRECPA